MDRSHFRHIEFNLRARRETVRNNGIPRMLILHTWYVPDYRRRIKTVCTIDSDCLTVDESSSGTQQEAHCSRHLSQVDTDHYHTTQGGWPLTSPHQIPSLTQMFMTTVTVYR